MPGSEEITFDRAALERLTQYNQHAALPTSATVRKTARLALAEIDRLTETAAQLRTEQAATASQLATLTRAMDRLFPEADDHAGDCEKANGHGCSLRNVLTEVERMLIAAATTAKAHDERIRAEAVEAALTVKWLADKLNELLPRTAFLSYELADPEWTMQDFCDRLALAVMDDLYSEAHADD